MIVSNKHQAVLSAINDNKALEGPLLPILHQIQESLGHIPSEHVADIAEALNLSRAEVHGVISFYHTFTTAPHGQPPAGSRCGPACFAHEFVLAFQSCTAG